MEGEDRKVLNNLSFVQVCQSQRIKMAWSPLRLLRRATDSLRGRFKDESSIDSQDYLAELFGFIHSPMRSGGLGKREYFVDHRTQLRFVVEFEEGRELARAAHQQTKQRQLLEEASMEIDLRQAGGRAIKGYAARRLDDLDRGFERFPARAVDHHVRSAAGHLGNHLAPIRVLVIRAAFDAEFTRASQFVVAP